MFKGNNPDRPAAEFLYHGNLEYGVICSRNQILYHIKKRTYDFMVNLHIGPIQFHPYARYVDFNETYSYKREEVNFKWGNMQSDLYYISKHYPELL